MLIQRDDRERAVEALCEAYPKTFFAIGQTRRPLKIGIEEDIKAEICSDSELRFYDIDDTLEWYRTHVGYQLACASAGAIRLDLASNVAGKITVTEAREYEESAQQAFARINAAKRAFASPLPTPPPAPQTALMVNSALNTPEMLALVEKQIVSLKAILVGDAIDESLRGSLARPVLQLIRDELQTIDARLG